MKTLLLVMAASMLVLTGCEEGPSGVNPSLELSVLDASGRQVNFTANMMLDGSDVKQCQIPFDTESVGFNSIAFTISNGGYISQQFAAQNLGHLLNASLTINLPANLPGKGAYSLDTASSTSATFQLGDILYTSAGGKVTLTDVAFETFGPLKTVDGAAGYLSATFTGRNTKTPSDTKIYTLTISSCVFNNMPRQN